MSRPSLQDRQEILANWVGPNSGYLAKLLKGGYSAAFDQALLTYMEQRVGPKYFFAPGDVPGDVSWAWAHLPQQANGVIATADQTVAHVFPFQNDANGNPIQLPANISWLAAPAGVTNPEFIHTLNRQTFWQNLALAYRLTEDPKYANELIGELTSWAQQNPPLGKPDDWENTEPRWWLLDAAMRVDNWVWSYEMLLGTAAWTPAANTLFLHEMMLHGQFLNGATPQQLTTNQAVQQGRALFEVGLMFPEFAGASKWEQNGLNLLVKCMGRQLYPDGGQAEESPDYQADVLENLLDPYQLSALNGVTWRRAQVRQLRNTAESYYQLLYPDGTEPALSDTFHSTGLKVIADAARSLGVPDALYTRTRIGDVFQYGQAIATEGLSVTGAEDLTGRGLDYAMPDSGYWITRSGADRDARQIVLDAGPTGGGTHGHLDLLNFELYGYGKTLIADPGPYQYDGSKTRAYVRSTPAHNTISVDGKSHAELDGVGNPNIVFDGVSATADGYTWSAHHFGYSSLKGSPAVGRTVWFNRDDEMLVVDTASGSSSHTFTSGFNLPGTAVSYVENGDEIHTTNASGNVMIVSILLPGQTVARAKTITADNPPPDVSDPAVRYSVSQAGTSALIANLIVTYAGATPPSVTATWAALPRRGRPGVVSITRDGVTQLVTVPLPNLSSHTPAAR